MNKTKKLGLILASLVLWGALPAYPQELDDVSSHEAMGYRDGEISVTFEQTPVVVALNVIEAWTGFQIIVPAAVESKLVNLRLNRLPLEPAFRSLISSIGFSNFALMYDANGRPNRAVVLDAQPEALTSAEDKSDDAVPASEPLATGEREKLQRELERWRELKQEERGRIEDRLKSLPPSDEREQLLQEYGRQILGVKK
ncbi:MAG: hypothetical protein Q8S00_28865 [Deltaproteobacteria bacterium]|nr:hypothetical protein [Deltaproteobacteria bacterium]MDZ4344889.1 hypothetical protein [Candidatus Binatia bacterium]